MKIEKLTIVGGGTSGWLAAAYLSHNIPQLHITVIDKAIGESVGVGEGTLLSLGPFLDECGFEFDDWFYKIDATYKSAILFKNWLHQEHDVWHPFNKLNTKIDSKFRLQDFWSQNQDLDYKVYASGFYETSVKYNSVDVEQSAGSYAFHVDCGKLVSYIQSKLKNKIQFIKSDVVNIETDQTGNINKLHLDNGQEIVSDLYIDCTGWKGLLKKPNKRVDLSDRLFCNTAVAGHVPYKDRDNELNPYVISEAVDHGWIWNIPVHSRIGSGLVFNRDITPIEEAKEYFCTYWDNRISSDNLKVLDWTPYYIEDMWSGNVVKIGLSAGFIEPLESTGVALITFGVAQLNNALQSQLVTDNNIDYFNLQMKIVFEDCVDFVSMHYHKNQRDTDFWRWVKSRVKISNKMQHYIDFLKDPNTVIPVGGQYNSVFVGANWSLWLIQMGYDVAERITGCDKDTAREIVLNHYFEIEKFRHLRARHHAKEIDRIHFMKQNGN
jgi:tryptophan 7-halogenase